MTQEEKTETLLRAAEKLLDFAQYIDDEYGTTYLGDGGETITTVELLKQWLDK
jgi:hypothetical protein